MLLIQNAIFPISRFYSGSYRVCDTVSVDAIASTTVSTFSIAVQICRWREKNQNSSRAYLGICLKKRSSTNDTNKIRMGKKRLNVCANLQNAMPCEKCNTCECDVNAVNTRVRPYAQIHIELHSSWESLVLWTLCKIYRMQFNHLRANKSKVVKMTLHKWLWWQPWRWRR